MNNIGLEIHTSSVISPENDKLVNTPFPLGIVAPVNENPTIVPL